MQSKITENKLDNNNVPTLVSSLSSSRLQQQQSTDSATLCVICLTRNRALALVPCGHFNKYRIRIFVGVINPVALRAETAEEVCERVLEAAKYIPFEQLDTTDDCKFSPFDDDQSTPRQIAFDKIRARLEGTRMAEEQLMARKRTKI
ncbi:unnamed protein product [Adineta steineri]|uniref:Uncharacterized protein n=2 Tax=Adineta steineri TaxID=433720 RepID=A0A819WGC2_9BILA|nr:unnamed protein product [Adineta steineri]